MVFEGWQSRTLDDCATFVSGGTPSKSRTDFWTGTIPWVSAKDLKVFRLHDAEDHVTVDAVRAGSRLAPAGSIFLLVRGMTLHNDVPICVAMREMAFNQDIKALMPKSGVDASFLTYWLLSQKSALLSSVDSAGHGTGRLNTDTLKAMTVALPPLAEQKAIAGVLGALDDKIELNRRMNATLESMARALFQSWFVDFDPVRAKLDDCPPTGMDKATADLFPDSFQESSLGCVPKGWETGSILRQADLLSGGTPKTDVAAYWNGDVPWASAKDVSQCGEAFLVSTERTITKLGIEESSTKIISAFSTVVVARGATTGRLTMFGHAMAMNQTCYGLRTKVGAPFSLYCNARHFIERIVQGGHGSIFDTITTSTFEATDVLLAPNELLLAFDKQVSPLFQQLHANLHQSRTLAILRDTLLPKLLGGELSVAEASRNADITG